MKGPLPSAITIDPTRTFSAAEVRALEQTTGHSLLDDDGRVVGAADMLQAMVWLALHRQGYSPTWDDCAEIVAVPPEQ